MYLSDGICCCMLEHNFDGSQESSLAMSLARWSVCWLGSSHLVHLWHQKVSTTIRMQFALLFLLLKLPCVLIHAVVYTLRLGQFLWVGSGLVDDEPASDGWHGGTWGGSEHKNMIPIGLWRVYWWWNDLTVAGMRRHGSSSAWYIHYHLHISMIAMPRQWEWMLLVLFSWCSRWLLAASTRGKIISHICLWV